MRAGAAAARPAGSAEVASGAPGGATPADARANARVRGGSALPPVAAPSASWWCVASCLLLAPTPSAETGSLAAPTWEPSTCIMAAPGPEDAFSLWCGILVPCATSAATAESAPVPGVAAKADAVPDTAELAFVASDPVCSAGAAAGCCLDRFSMDAAGTPTASEASPYSARLTIPSKSSDGDLVFSSASVLSPSMCAWLRSPAPLRLPAESTSAAVTADPSRSMKGSLLPETW